MTIDQFEKECDFITFNAVIRADMFGNIYMCHTMPLPRELIKIGETYFKSDKTWEYDNSAYAITIRRESDIFEEEYNYRKIIRQYT